MPPPFVWHVWPAQGWPATAEQELCFVEDLRAAAHDQVAQWSRPNITCLLGALRCGVTVETLMNALPGLVPAELLACYELLEYRRATAEAAWRQLVGEASAHSLAEHAEHAQVLLPVPVARIATGATTMRGHGGFERVVLSVATDVSAVGDRAHALERALAALGPGDPRGKILGAQLHHPLDPALWSDPYYLPSRVGALSPMRVADLLGERPANEDTEWDR